MARKITVDFTFDDDENEVLYTRASVMADPDAADLLPTTDGWLGLIDAARAKDRAARAAAQEAAAARGIANRRLDRTCRSFGRELAAELANERSVARWTRFFRTTVDAFVSQPLGEQAAACLAWLSIEDAVLARHREALERWARAAQAALTRTSESAQVRGAALVAREQLAEDLTRGRDGLEALLTQRGLERDLGRDFAAGFFIQARKKAKKGADDEPAGPA